MVMTGAAVEVTLGTTARVSLGPIYDRGTERFRVSSGPSYDIADERYDCATGCEEVIVEDRRMIAKDIYLYAANELEDNAMKRTIVGYASVTLEAPEVELKSTLTLNAKTTGAMLFNAGNFDVEATIAVRIMAKGLIKLG